MTPELPPGFEPHDRSSPFLDLIGPLYSAGHGEDLRLALCIDERHLNGRGSAHGGVLCALADLALGYPTALSVDPPAALTTVSLSIDFAGSVRAGDIITTETEVQRVGQRIAYANCYLNVEERRLVRASAVFARQG